MLQVKATWPIKPSCDLFTSLIKYYPMLQKCSIHLYMLWFKFFFQSKYYPVLQKCFFCLFFFFQSETVIYLVTEPVRPLEVQLNEEEKSDLAISWGLHQITVSIILNRYT